MADTVNHKKRLEQISIVILVVTTFLLIVSAAKLLNYIFPALALMVAIFLYQRHSILYIGLTWWIWFLAPIVRRISDYKSEYHDPSLILLTPFLISSICLPSVLYLLPKKAFNVGLPFTLAFFSLSFALSIGLINFPIQTVLTSALEWIAPVIFGAYLFLNWRMYPEQKKITKKVFLGMVILTGIYGIYQYLVAPDWDTFWLINSEMTSAGRPFPQEIRVWSTMHGPGVFAAAMMAGLILVSADSSPLAIPSLAVGAFAFLLSLVRSSWVGWLIGTTNFMLSAKPKLQIRFISFVIIVSLILIPFLLTEPFSEIVVTRLQTFSNIESDESGQARSGIYSSVLQEVSDNFIGEGLSKTGRIVDSGILQMLLSLGWIGTFIYISALVLIVRSSYSSAYQLNDPFSKAVRSIILAMYSTLIFGVSMIGLPGMIFWGFSGLYMSAQQYSNSELLKGATRSHQPLL
jgi:hypothetical protein